jgi:branched-chain amino acid transport system permease protein
VIVRPVYGLHLKQILITMGGMIVGEEIIKVIWGPLQIAAAAARGCAAPGWSAMRDREVPRAGRGIGLVVFARWPGRWRAPRSAC